MKKENKNKAVIIFIVVVIIAIVAIGIASAFMNKDDGNSQNEAVNTIDEIRNQHQEPPILPADNEVSGSETPTR